MKAEFLQLAHTYKPGKHSLAGQYVSEKLDGQRAFWDGGITRGMPAAGVPWSNTAKDKHDFKSTGLWSRYGKVIHAPGWWLDKLPRMMLDGEMYAGRGKFQLVESVCRTSVGTSDWRPIKYMVFDSPPCRPMFADRDIENPNWVAKLRGMLTFAAPLIDFKCMGDVSGFQSRYEYLRDLLPRNEVVDVHQQHLLAFDTQKATREVGELLDSIVSNGGEGVILKSRSNIWSPVRAKDMLKWKPFHDLEATVVGYTTGRETDKGSKLLGLMGALICRIPKGEFKVSGFTDVERGLTENPASSVPYRDDMNSWTATGWAAAHPEEVCPDWISSIRFPRGSVVTIKYRETTDAGLPKEARYWRDFNA